jgi:hypothetical protein
MSVTHQNESYVADAHALVWHIADDKRLGKCENGLVAPAPSKPRSLTSQVLRYASAMA